MRVRVRSTGTGLNQNEMEYLSVFNFGLAYLSRPSSLVEGTCDPQRASVL